MSTLRIASLVTFIAAYSVVSTALGAANGPGDYYVTAEQVQERLGPSPNARSTNTLAKRQKVTVFEVKSGWARVSKHYDGEVEGVKGQVARWVPAKDLSQQRPSEEKVAAPDSPLRRALKDSDDFAKHHTAFLDASKKLVDSGTCSLQDFESNGGWMKSTNQAGAVYFVYCGGLHRSNRLYLDVATGRTFR